MVCPVGGCQTALNSSYAELFGLPSLYGAVACFIVAFSFSGSNINPEESKELESKYKKISGAVLQYMWIS